MELPEYIYKDTRDPPQILEEVKAVEVKPEDLSALGAAPKQNTDAPVVPSENERLAAETDVDAATAANTAANAGPLGQGQGQGQGQGEQLPQQQQQQQQMPVMMPMMVPMMMAPQGMQQGAPPLQYINPAGPGAPPTLVVDTSREAMEESGFIQQQQQQGQPQARPANNQTRRNSRGVSFQQPQQQQQQQQQGQQHNVKVTINKLG